MSDTSDSNMTDRAAKKKGPKKKAQRATSNVFAMFTQEQIQEFKEVFNMIDQNRTGAIDREELEDVYESLGIQVSDAHIDKMMNEVSGSINFTAFLTLFGEKLHGTDPEEVIRNAFAAFDPEGKGVLFEDDIRDALLEMGERFDEDEVDDMLDDAPVDDDGMFDYVKYSHQLKWGHQLDLKRV